MPMKILDSSQLFLRSNVFKTIKMKKLQLLILLILSSLSSIAQDSLPVPEFNAMPYYLNNGELIVIERNEAVFDTKVKGMGYGGGEYFYSVFGLTSKTRFDKNKFPRIFIKVETKGDPKDLIEIVAEDTKKKNDRRRFKQGSRNMYGKAKDVSENKVEFVLKKLKPNVYEIIFESPLKPGEYAFMPVYDDTLNPLNGGATKVSCFGID